MRLHSLVVGVRAFVLATGLAAGAAAIPLPPGLEAEADQVSTGAMVARNGVSDHENSLPQQLMFRYYQSTMDFLEAAAKWNALVDRLCHFDLPVSLLDAGYA